MTGGSTLYCIQRFLVPALGQVVKNISLNWANLMCNWLPACKSISDFKLLWKACGGLPPFYICLPLLLIYSLVNILKIKKNSQVVLNLGNLQNSHDGRISCLGMSSDGSALCTGSWDKNLKVRTFKNDFFFIAYFLLNGVNFFMPWTLTVLLELK